jgi:hypothetical protein
MYEWSLEMNLIIFCLHLRNAVLPPICERYGVADGAVSLHWSNWSEPASHFVEEILCPRYIAEISYVQDLCFEISVTGSAAIDASRFSDLELLWLARGADRVISCSPNIMHSLQL